MTVPVDPAGRDDDRMARAALGWFAEPGSRIVWDMVQQHGAAETLTRVLRGEVVGLPWATALRVPDSTMTSISDLGRLAEQVRHDARRAGARIVVPTDDEWPRQLDDLASLELDTSRWVDRNGRPPLCLWVRGSLPLAETVQRSVAVVGSREATGYGITIAADITASLTADGWTVVSGGAVGVDTAALRAALVAGGRPVVVLGCGVDRTYPAENASLFEQIAGTGLLVSEWPPGASPEKHRFVIRNRTIAALTRATVATECALDSGTIEMMDRAFQLGKAGMLVPGPVTSATSAGCHELLRSRSQAILVTGPGDVRTVLSEIGPDETAGGTSGQNAR